MINEQFVKDIVELLWEQDDDDQKIRGQIPDLIDADYEHTGVGIFVGFRNKNGAGFNQNFEERIYDGITIKSEEVEIGVNAKIVIKGNEIHSLEIWSFSGDFPEKIPEKYLFRQKQIKAGQKRI